MLYNRKENNHDKKASKFLVMLTILGILLTPTSLIYANENGDNSIDCMSYDEKVEYIQYLGISQEDSLAIPEWIMNDLILDNQKIETYSYTITPMEENLVTSSVTRTIDQNILLVYNFVSKNTNKSTNNADYFDIKAYANWGGTPLCYFTDVFATEWSSDCSLDTEWCGIRHTLNGNSYTDCPLSACSVNNGVAHKVDIKIGQNNYITQKITIWRAKQSQPYNLAVASSYAHKTVSLLGEISTSFGSGRPSFSAPISVTYEEAHPGYCSMLVE